MASLDRDPKFYSELKQTNEDILKVLEGTHKRSPYFDYSDTFQDYMKQITELHKRYPLGSQITDQITSSTNTNDVAYNFKFSNNIISNSPPGNTATMNNTSLFNQNETNNLSSSVAPSNGGGVSSGSGSGGASQGDAEADGEPYAPPQPSLDIFEEPNYRYKTRCKLYERQMGGGGGSPQLLGCGFLYVKDLDAPSKLHLIVRKDPDLRTIILNQVITSSTPLRLQPKAVTIMIPGPDGKTKCFITKVKDEVTASEVFGLLQKVKNAS